jgi:hypothetical protein
MGGGSIGGGSMGGGSMGGGSMGGGSMGGGSMGGGSLCGGSLGCIKYPQRWARRLGAAASGDDPNKAAFSVFKVFLFSFAIREAMELLLIV